MKEARNLLISGISGTGKSYDLGSEIEKMVLDEDFFIVLLDPKMGDEGVYGDHKGMSADLDFVHLHINEAVIEKASKQDWRDIIQGIRSEGFPGVRFTFESIQPEMDDWMPKFGDRCSRIVLGMEGKVGLAIEELQNFCPHQSMGGSSDEIKGTIKLIDEGRTINKAFLGATQKLQKVHTAVYGACNRYRMYHMGSQDSDYSKVLNVGEHREEVDEIQAADLESRKCLEFYRQTSESEILHQEGLERRTRHLG